MLLRESFAGALPPMDAGPGGNAGKPRGSGIEWKTQNEWPYPSPVADLGDDDDNRSDSARSRRLTARFTTKVGLVVPRRDMGGQRVDVGSYVGGQSGTFSALEEWGGVGVTPTSSVGFMPNSIVPLVHFNRMTNRSQNPNDPAQIPNITSGPGVKHRTGTIYGTSHPSFLAGDDQQSFIPGRGDILPDRDERGLIKALRRFHDLHDKKYGKSSSKLPVIVGEWK